MKTQSNKKIGLYASSWVVASAQSRQKSYLLNRFSQGLTLWSSSSNSLSLPEASVSHTR